MSFIRCRFQGEDIADFCIQYRVALDSCAVAGIAIQPTIQVLHFVTILDTHYEHWCANKREQMRRDPDHLPTLDALIHEVTHEALRKRDHASLQITTVSPKRQCIADVYSYCGLSHHRIERCFYKHVHLCRPGWQLNSTILQCIKSKQKTLQINTSQPPTSDSKSSDHDFDIFACTYL